MSKPIEWDAALLKRVVEQQLQSLAYGSINITVHGGEIVQIERTERQRHDRPTDRGRRQQRGYR